MRGLSVGRLFKRLRGLRKETVCVTGQKQGGPTRRVPPRASRCHRRARRWPLATMFLWYAIAALGPLRSPKEQGGNLPRRRAAVTPKAPKRSGGVAQRLDGGSAAWPLEREASHLSQGRPETALRTAAPHNSPPEPARRRARRRESSVR